MDSPAAGGPYDRLASLLSPLRLSMADHIALTASYDQCVALTMQLHGPDDAPVRAMLLDQSLPRMAVTGMTVLGGLVSYLNHPDTSVKPEVREMLRSSAAAGQYPEPGLPGPGLPGPGRR